MSALARWVFNNWPLKLTALGLAVVLYAGVALSESTRSWAGPVPIEVLNAPVGGALLDDPGVIERIEYRASDDIADALTHESFRASIDLSAVEPRAGAAPVEVPVDVFPVDPRVRVVGFEPPGVAVRVDEVVSRMMPVVIEHRPLPEGIDIGPVSVQPNQVTISGASSRLQNVRTVEGRVVVDGSDIDIDEDVAVEVFDQGGAIVPGVDIEPATVRVRADVDRQLAYATLPVLPELVGEPANWKRVDSVSVQPATVTVSGEDPAVRALEFVTTEPVDISGRSEELEVQAALVFPEEVTSAAEEAVTVRVTFTDTIGSRAFEVGSAFVGADPSLAYRLDQPSLSVVVSGPIALLDGLAVDDVSVALPVADLEVGDNEVMPIVRTPPGTSVVSVSPEIVRVTVEAAS